MPCWSCWGYLLYQAWDKDHPKLDFPPAATQTAGMTIPGAPQLLLLPRMRLSSVAGQTATANAPAAPVAQQTGQIVTVTPICSKSALIPWRRYRFDQVVELP